MKNVLLFVLLFFQVLFASADPSRIKSLTPIKLINKSILHNWVRVKGKVIAIGYEHVTIRDSTGVVTASFKRDKRIQGLNRNDVITLTGIVCRRSNSLKLRIQHIEKEEKTLYVNISHSDIDIPPGYAQKSLNRVILSKKKKYTRRAVIYSSIGATAQLAPFVIMAPLIRNSTDGGSKFGLYLFTMALEFRVMPVSIPFLVAGKRNRYRAQRTPSLIPEEIPELDEIELDLSLQVKPVHNGGGLFLVGNF